MKYHCMICKKIHHNGRWRPIEQYNKLDYTSGVYHEQCIDIYHENYATGLSQEDLKELKQNALERIAELEAKKWRYEE